MHNRRLSPKQMASLVGLRHTLHARPELPDHEVQTAKTVARFCHGVAPNARIYEHIGGCGVLVRFEGADTGPSLMLRCELDALPITEAARLPYASQNPHTAHACGHDGHIAILCGVAACLNTCPLPKGSVALLFQPAEETGAGARRMVPEIRALGYSFDYAFALHNLPGAPLGAVVWYPEVYAAASHGLEVTFTGRVAHASEPHKAVTPTFAVMETIQAWTQLAQTPELFSDYVLITVVHVDIGEAAYGTTPGRGVLRATFRANRQDDLDKLHRLSVARMREIAGKYMLRTTFTLHDVFPATLNHPDANGIVCNAANTLGMPLQQAAAPLPGSDDFAFFAQHSVAAFFDLGAGPNHLPLHDSGYDFPDALIPVGLDLWMAVIEQAGQT